MARDHFIEVALRTRRCRTLRSGCATVDAERGERARLQAHERQRAADVVVGVGAMLGGRACGRASGAGWLSAPCIAALAFVNEKWL
jgi:hypothetical protein